MTVLPFPKTRLTHEAVVGHVARIDEMLAILFGFANEGCWDHYASDMLQSLTDDVKTLHQLLGERWTVGIPSNIPLAKDLIVLEHTLHSVLQRPYHPDDLNYRALHKDVPALNKRLRRLPVGMFIETPITLAFLRSI